VLNTFNLKIAFGLIIIYLFVWILVLASDKLLATCRKLEDVSTKRILSTESDTIPLWAILLLIGGAIALCIVLYVLKKRANRGQ